tara:strand:- start:14684 stop:15760 length:1077 start_codon:yes stop_codon:yes gene_type:complete
MKLLRLTPALKSTSAPYNQFSLGFKETIDQTLFSLNAHHDVEIDKKISVSHSNGSIVKAFFTLKKLIQINKYDIVHIHNGLTGVIFLIAILPFNARLLNKTVFTLHNSWHVLKSRNKFLDLLVMIFSKSVCACGQSSYDSIPNVVKFLIGKKIISVSNGFDHERIDRVEKKRGTIEHFSSTKLKIVCVGVLNNTKNQIALLKVLKKTQINAEVVFLGDGINKQKLINFSKSISRSVDISFKGLVSRDIAIEHMLEADLFISLSKGEGLPIAVLEAMYAGCFLILSSIPPHIEVSPPRDRCNFVQLANNDEVIQSLNNVISNLREIKMGRHKSKEYAITNFSINNMLQTYMKVYESLKK